MMKISTFNLFNYLAPPGAYYDFQNIYSYKQWQDKQHWIAQQIVLADSDIIGFQEIFSPKELQQQLVALGYPYFAVVDAPKVEDEFIYSEPVVGIASRYPIVSVTPVTAEPAVAEELRFNYSRIPLHALVDVPHIGHIDCVVVHFKSQRPMELANSEKAYQPIESWRSTMQRGLEIRFLLAYLSQRKQAKGYPQLLMGDFNRGIEGDEFSCLHNQTQDNAQMLLLDAKKVLDEEVAFQPTHYYGAKGSVLDYILLSEEFDGGNAAGIYEVTEYRVFDSHLVNPIYATDYMASDHAVVTITAVEK
jgi:endonuclease/exonuclease/phosphatase family metal-dependent hydrolase